MDPLKVKASSFMYGAPPGEEAHIGGLPCWREADPRTGRTTVYSAWRADPMEVEALKRGGTVILGIHGMEPIPPVSIGVAFLGRSHPRRWVERVVALLERFVDHRVAASDDPRAVEAS